MKCDAERLAEIGARVVAASPAPWESSEQEVYRGESGLLAVIAHSHPAARVKTYCVAIIRRLGKHGGHGFGREVGEANRAFIAHARADVPDLLADLREARAALVQVHLLKTDGATLATAKKLGLEYEYRAHGPLTLQKIVWGRAAQALGKDFQERSTR